MFLHKIQNLRLLLLSSFLKGPLLCWISVTAVTFTFQIRGGQLIFSRGQGETRAIVEGRANKLNYWSKWANTVSLFNQYVCVGFHSSGSWKAWKEDNWISLSFLKTKDSGLCERRRKDPAVILTEVLCKSESNKLWFSALALMKLTILATLLIFSTHLHNTWVVIQCKSTNFRIHFSHFILLSFQKSDNFPSDLNSAVTLVPFTECIVASSSVISNSCVRPPTKVSNWAVLLI